MAAVLPFPFVPAMCTVLADNLIIPTLNDNTNDIRELANWVYHKLGPNTPLHFSRFHPENKLTQLSVTPEKTLVNAHEIAKDVGLKFVYLGNIYHPRYGNTYCPHCDHLVIRRGSIFGTKGNDLVKGRCVKCNKRILKYF